jgi:hypothetical protein
MQASPDGSDADNRHLLQLQTRAPAGLVSTQSTVPGRHAGH